MKGAAMKLIGSRLHGILDYLTVAVFALAPTVLELRGIAVGLSYTLAVAHLLVTLATDFDRGVVHLLPAHWHGWIEFVVALVLLAAPWILGFGEDPMARSFFVAAGAVIFLVWALTAYRGWRPASGGLGRTAVR
jgi:hypothetical protein